MSVIGWLTLAGAAVLAWVALPSLAPSWRLCASIAFTTLVAIVMLHPPETVVAEPEVAPERGVPAARAAERPRPQRPPAKAAPAPEAPAPAAPRPAADPCVALAGLKKEQCKACGGTTGLTRVLCEGAATNRYCNDKTGSDPDCPDAAAPDPA